MPFSDISLQQVKLNLERNLATGNLIVDDIVLQPIKTEGKLIRPRLVLMSSLLFAEPDARTIDIASAVECIHTASLIHDDIIDRAKWRRGQPSTVALFGAKASVLVGDHYFATAFRLIAQHGLTEILDDLCQVVRDMVRGEMRQDIWLFNVNTSEADYYHNIFGKTASLFAGACRAGARVANASTQKISLLGEIGEELGYAYQIIDDLIDLAGSEEELGKPVGSDLRNGIITLPIIYTLEIAPEREWVASTISSRSLTVSDYELIATIALRCGALEHTRAAAFEHIKNALNKIEDLPNSPAKEEFRQFAVGIAANLMRVPLLNPPDINQSVVEL